MHEERREPTASEPTPDPDSRRRGRLTLLLANSIPLVGVLGFGWDLISLLLLYWMESLVVALIASVRIALAPGRMAVGGLLLFALAFIVLAAAHLVVIVVLADAVGIPTPDALNPAAFADAPLFTALAGIYRGGLGWIVADYPGLLVSAFPALGIARLYGIKARPGSASSALRTALLRWIVLHLAVLFGAAAMAALQVQDLVLVLAALVALKTMIDLRQ